MKKFLSLFTVACLLISSGLISVSADGTDKEELGVSSFVSDDSVVIYASDEITQWTPLLSTSAYGAKVTFTNSYSGSITVEIWNTSGKVDSFTESFTSKGNLQVYKSLKLSGSYKIVIKVTIGSKTITRESNYMSV